MPCTEIYRSHGVDARVAHVIPPASREALTRSTSEKVCADIIHRSPCSRNTLDRPLNRHESAGVVPEVYWMVEILGGRGNARRSDRPAADRNRLSTRACLAGVQMSENTT